MKKEQILSQMNKEELTEFLQKAVQIPSHIEIEDEEKEIAKFIADRLRKEGITTELQIVEKERPNVIAIIPGSGEGKGITLNGHMDSIPPFDMEDPIQEKLSEMIYMEEEPAI